MQADQFRKLLEGFLRNTLSQQELIDFIEAAKLEKFQLLLRQEIESSLKSRRWEGLADVESADDIYNKIVAQEFDGVVQHGRQTLYRWLRFTAAAVLVLVLGAAGYYLLNQRTEMVEPVASVPAKQMKNDVYPARSKTILQLADGRQVVLDSTSGVVSKEGRATVINSEGELQYASEGNKKEEVVFHTLQTGKGNQYQVVLPDGTKVWLNAMSSLRFPTAFTGKERRVEVSGEAYFEVAHNISLPFRVSIMLATGQVGTSQGGERGEIEVLGTSFNINAYAEEMVVKTTLLQGSVKVKKGSSSMVIEPGQQARISEDDGLSLVKQADLIETMAWKDGRFHFDGADIETILKQLSRWYDIEVEYKEKVPYTFVAKISRDVPISELLKLMELTELVHFRIEGKKVVVMR